MTTEISASQVKELREKTGAALMDCKKALKENGGDLEKATDWLRKKGMETAGKKASRAAKEGRVYSYIHHNGKIGVLLELDCETDFVAKNPEYEAFAKEVAMQIAAIPPLYVSREDVPAELIEREKDIYREQVKDKPEQAQEKILEGKLNKFFAQVCLLENPTVKDPKTSVGDALKALIAKLGENIILRRFARFAIGEE